MNFAEHLKTAVEFFRRYELRLARAWGPFPEGTRLSMVGCDWLDAPVVRYHLRAKHNGVMMGVIMETGETLDRLNLEGMFAPQGETDKARYEADADITPPEM